MDTKNSKELFKDTCPTNSEPYVLQNLGDMMMPEFSENTIIVIDPAMQIHNFAYAVIEYQDELYFRQYIKRGARKFMVALNTNYDEIELRENFTVRGCVVQQKQRKQKPRHYYHLNQETKELDFSQTGREK